MSLRPQWNPHPVPGRRQRCVLICGGVSPPPARPGGVRYSRVFPPRSFQARRMSRCSLETHALPAKRSAPLAPGTRPRNTCALRPRARPRAPPGLPAPAV